LVTQVQSASSSMQNLMYGELEYENGMVTSDVVQESPSLPYVHIAWDDHG